MYLKVLCMKPANLQLKHTDKGDVISIELTCKYLHVHNKIKN